MLYGALFANFHSLVTFCFDEFYQTNWIWVRQTRVYKPNLHFQWTKKKTQDLHMYNEWTEYMYLDSWDEEKLFNTCNLYNENGWPFTLIHVSY